MHVYVQKSTSTTLPRRSLAVRIGTARAIIVGFGLAVIGFGAIVFVQASWRYALLVPPLIVLSAGLGIANGPASSASTSAVEPDEVGQASGISNMARYVGGSLAVAAVATIYNSTIVDHERAGASPSDALAAGLSRSALFMAICAAGGVALVVLLRRHHLRKPQAVDLAAAAAATTHTIPTRPTAS